jgi:diaminohydroxyphosphoribosylaminopyrimidine deaminase/5-amino-6-(5-phosphoribosylamino)uracil reductase
MISRYMQRAVELADAVVGTTSPNPPVGCVIAREGEIVGEGATQPPGEAHAEVMALHAAGAAAKGGIAYVTLEPCSHRGRTPPCAEAIVKAGIAKVVAAVGDPDARVAGEGLSTLRAAGIEVEVGDGAEESGKLLEAYLKQRATGMPFVIAKFAATLDGKIAASSGDSRWIAGEKARAWAHRFRSRIDAIMCGVNNVLLDDPQLSARPDGKLAGPQPIRIVADSRGRTPPEAKVLGAGGPTIIATTEASAREWRKAIEARGAEVLVAPADSSGRVHLVTLLSILGSRGVLSLLAEGGGVLHASLFEQRVVDKVHAIIAAKILGGTAYPAVAGDGAARMDLAVTLRDVEIQRLGDDAVIVGYPVYPGPSA